MAAFNAKTGMDIAFASIFVLAIGLTVADDIVTALNLTGIAGTVVGYSTLVIGAAFLYGVARLAGVL